MLVWREKDGWQGPYNLVVVDDHDVTLDLPNGPVKFRSTAVKRYLRDSQQGTELEAIPEEIKDTIVVQTAPPAPEPVLPRRRGRPQKKSCQQ
jgi:hypothetical protein